MGVVSGPLHAGIQRQANRAQPLGLISVLAGVLAALQTFLGLGARADRHRAAGSAYGAVRREIEQYHAVPPPRTAEAVKAVMNRLRERLDAIAEKAPGVPDRTWDKAWKKPRKLPRPAHLETRTNAGGKPNCRRLRARDRWAASLLPTVKLSLEA
jgi:hypothetical protein